MTGCVSMTKVQRGTAAVQRRTGTRVLTQSLIVALLAAGAGMNNAIAAPPSATVGLEAGSLVSTRSVLRPRVIVTEREFSITLDRRLLRPGKYTFALQNKGENPHNLIVNGPGVRSQTPRPIAAGRSGSLTVTLRKGTYKLWCGLPGHETAGMHTTITVR